ncbi:SMP-30/gluconolactonase/LRE family protein [Sphingosinicella sp. BN140058]|uniref:SMP-30/gluconolactonase/LRE family protein n=1 Tax=Sphingosinicella sp. BN140058 TaxID=1892855 RepID=UPI00197EDA44|nr:SMP-30/gluconolactonase/LRE family protein [Sphingosinicella sp. BN140058]
MPIGAALLAGVLLSSTPGTAQLQPQPQPPQTQTMSPGRPLGVAGDQAFTPISSNVRVYGGIVSAESCVYDPSRKLILAVNRGAPPDRVANDGFISLINPDGTVHTARWIGLESKDPVLNQPFGSAIHRGHLYVADSVGGTADGAKRSAIVRVFDLATGGVMATLPVPDSPWLNDIAVASDGTIFGSQTGAADGSVPMRIYRIGPNGTSSILAEGAPLSRPNGVEIDPQGNIVVLNLSDDAVMTFSPAGTLLRTERAAQAGNDGLVILADGTKYISSVVNGGVSRIRPGRPAELVATGIPNAASMCYDPDDDQLVIPMNANNGLAFIKLSRGRKR